MTIAWRLETPETLGPSRYRASERLAIAAIAFALGAAPALANGGFCSRTASAQLTACRHEVRDDFYTARASCINVSDREDRADCFAVAKEERRDDNRLCREQRRARRDLCDALGEDRYDAHFDPAAFDADFRKLTNPNPYFPLGIGSRWEYVGGDETITVRVRNRTKLIQGVTCIVVNDRVEEDGKAVEVTDDWFGQRQDGTVDYCGEISRNFEVFEGDDPEEAELVDLEGSWKAGRDGAVSGTLFPGFPFEGQVYRQEFAPGDAEDAARVLSTHYGFGSDPELDAFVPRKLAELLCSNDCVVTREFTPLEPDAFERKYYAPGVGLFLEVDPKSGEIVQLVGCNVDPSCAALPKP